MMETERVRDSSAMLSERVCDSVCVLFAVWTLCCHCVVSIGGSLYGLLMLSVCVYSGLGFVLFRGRRRYGRAAGGGIRQGTRTIERLSHPGPLPRCPRLPQFPDLERPVFSSQFRTGVQAAGVVLGIAGALVVGRHGDMVAMWVWLVAVLSVAAVVFLLTEVPVLPSPSATPGWERALWGLSGICLVLTLIAHRSDPDDAFYVNLAVAAVDFPRAALLRSDTLHGIAGLPLHLPVYRVHSYELWNGALSYLTGIPAIYCFHWISAAIAAVFVPLAHARLFRLLTPDRWLWAVGVLIIVLVATGETHRWYGNFALVRVWQGKSIFLFVFLPLVYAYAIRFALQPSWRSGILLAAAQIAAIGCSSSALWAAPVSAAMALGSVSLPARSGFRVLGLGILSSGYLLGTAWFMRTGMQSRAANQLQQVSVSGEKLGEAFSIVLGNGHVWFIGILALFSAWAYCQQGLARRFAIGVPLIASVMLFNPYTADFVMANVTGPAYWRSFWAVPLPILLTLILIAPLQLEGSPGKRRGGRIVCLCVVVVFVVFVPRVHGLSLQNRVRIGLPGLKVPTAAYQSAAVLNRSVPPGAFVLAPEAVNTWIPTFHGHAYPVQVRRYLLAYREQLGIGNFRVRIGMTRYVTGKALPRDTDRFQHGLDRFSIQGVCLRHSAYVTEARAILQRAGFYQTHQGGGYEIWIRA